jgi:hypothetical protein
MFLHSILCGSPWDLFKLGAIESGRHWNTKIENNPTSLSGYDSAAYPHADLIPS